MHAASRHKVQDARRVHWVLHQCTRVEACRYLCWWHVNWQPVVSSQRDSQIRTSLSWRESRLFSPCSDAVGYTWPGVSHGYRGVIKGASNGSEHFQNFLNQRAVNASDMRTVTLQFMSTQLFSNKAPWCVVNYQLYLAFCLLYSHVPVSLKDI